jgi:hypothetical protein
MSSRGGRAWRLAGELALLSVVVTAVVMSMVYALESPFFDDPTRGETARKNFVNAARVLSVLGTAAAWVVWMTWRSRARVDAQPDGPARLLALGVATLPGDRGEWGAAMAAELASLSGRTDRWRFALSGVRAALTSPGGSRRPAAGWAGGTIGAIGVMACVAAAVHMLAVDAAASAATPSYVIVVLVIVLAGGLAMMLAAPPAISSSRAARHTGVWLGVAAGGGLLVWSRAGALESGAMALIVPVQLLSFVLAPAIVAAVARSLRAALQCIVWAYVFGAVTMFPVYILESIRRYRLDGGLYLDGDSPAGSTVANNLTDAVAWLVLVVPSLLIPLGVLAAGFLAIVSRKVAAR